MTMRNRCHPRPSHEMSGKCLTMPHFIGLTSHASHQCPIDVPLTLTMAMIAAQIRGDNNKEQTKIMLSEVAT